MTTRTPSPPIPSNLKSRLKASYDTIAPTYNAWTSQHFSVRLAQLNHLLDLLPSNPSPPQTTTVPLRALELGCGAGIPITSTLLSSPRSIPFHVTANDLSSTQIALARESLGSDPEKVEWLEGDMTALSFPAESFDVVIALYSIIHLPRDEQLEMIRKISAWLKPGGLVLMNFGEEESKGEESEGWLGEGGWMYWSGWGKERYLKEVEGVGIEVVREEGRLGFKSECASGNGSPGMNGQE
ncbi:S-adenosyl-L-methionine-dependent methyltransferase [Podospora aff. communis PSN243]|uniref:S-adenosyl-L-methionine-dependent methyltransferase n=1 Tax=Podospora aff. communis PSN243 TaxID=3040156 RepID=A0AAV9GBJ9_9PEZI|nr:S-adenosyl-L-methionine-dependent methyltransferase [Podospora aff. communis PSN243]